MKAVSPTRSLDGPSLKLAGVPLVVLLGGIVVGSCTAGGQTGDEFAPGTSSAPGDGSAAPTGSHNWTGEDGELGPCDESLVVTDDPDVVVDGLGFSAADVLSFAVGEFETTLRWNAVYGVSYGPEAGDVPMTLRVTQVGEPMHVIREPKSQTSGFVGEEGRVSECADALALDVLVELETAEGALDERFEAQLRAGSPLEASFSHRFELDALGGAFAITELVASERATSTEIVQPDLNVGLSPLGTWGAFQAIVQEHVGSGELAGISGRQAQFANWPAEPACGSLIPETVDRSSFLLPFDVEFGGPRIDEILTGLESAPPPTLRWSDGAESELAVELTPIDESACAGVDGDSPAFRFDATASMTSADGRIDYAGPVAVSSSWMTSSDPEDRVQGLSVRHRWQPSANELAAILPSLDFEAESYDYYSLLLELEYAVTPSDADGSVQLSATTGRVRAEGLTNTDCSNNPPGSACDGPAATQLERAEVVGAP